MKNLLVVVLVVLIPLALAAGSDENETGAEAKVETPKIITWQQLAEFIPDSLDGYAAGDLDGGTLSFADPSEPSKKLYYSTASRPFTTEERTIHIALMDSGLNPMLLAPYLMHLEYDSPEGSMKLAEVKGHRAMKLTEKDEGVVTSRQVVVLIAERIVLTVEGTGGLGDEEVMKIVLVMDIDGLAKLAD
jgi:hypothetical protein